jgi:ribosomal protein L7Ae-like RNA K-turn-binding protein
MLGFAMRAGKVIIGTELVCRAMPKKGKDALRLVLVSHEASPATKKKITVKCEYYGLRALEINLDTSELGRLLGKSFTPATVGITDDGFAEEIIRALSSPIKQ